MAVTPAKIAAKVLLLPEINSGDSLYMDDSLPNALANAFTNEGLVVTRESFSGVTSLTTDIVLTDNTTLVNKAIKNKKIDRDFDFLYLLLLSEEGKVGDMDENFELFKKGVLDLEDGDTMHYSVWRLTRVWVN